jgi:regulator of nucleoside diphosphate kinase
VETRGKIKILNRLMMNNEITVTKVDYSRLNSLILASLDKKNQDIRELNFLNIEIKRAQKIEPKRIQPNIVTMNSEIEVTFLDSKQSMVLRLVYPHDANYKEKLISVLSPLGCALLGYQVGSIVSFKTPTRTKEVRIDKVLFQPEANGLDLS